MESPRPTACPSCGHALGRGDVVGDEVVCGTCGLRTPVAELLFAEPPPAPSLDDAPRSVEIVRSVLPARRTGGYRDAIRQEGALTLRWRWFRPAHLALLVFTLFWDGFLVLWFTLAAFLGPLSIVLMCCPIVHVIFGVVLTYFTLAGLMNRTILELDEGAVRVRHGPLPWRGGVRVPAAELRAVRVREQTRRGSRSARGAIAYEVVVDTPTATVTLLTNLPDRATAEFVAGTLRAHLGLSA